MTSKPGVKRAERLPSGISATTALVLSQLKYPLVFFGLDLMIIESVFGIVLSRRDLSQTSLLAIVGCMTGLFLFSTLTVGLLVWRVPTHVMLTAQTHAQEDVFEQLRRATAASLILKDLDQQPRTVDNLLIAMEEVGRIFNDEEKEAQDV